MAELEWRSGNNIYKMLEDVRGKVSDRKLRLFAVACCHRPYYCIEDERHQRAVELAERMADEDVSDVEWQNIHQTAYELWQSTLAASISTQKKAPRGTHEGEKLVYADMATAAGWAVLEDAWEAAYQVTAVEWDEKHADEPDHQLAFLHDIFGKPSIRVSASWFTPEIFTFAQTIYADRAFGNLPILADALEEAGCDDAEILAHCRSGGEHVRGCWVVDLILGEGMSKDKKTQWHPLFADLLRPLLQDYYDIQINEPVGDLPREADILLLRRTSNRPTPFRGLWRHLTMWNVVEFKGPSESARRRDLSLLIELGLGIDRRLHHERNRKGQKPIRPEQVAFWYIARKIGPRVIEAARERLGHLEEIETGLWRSQVLQHLVFLVSSEHFATEPDSVPLHLLLVRSPEQERELAKLVIEQPHFAEWYWQHLGVLHSDVWQEVRHMAISKKHELKINYDFLAQDVDMDKFIASYDIERLIGIIGVKKFIKQVGVDRLLSNMPADELKKLKERLK